MKETRSYDELSPYVREAGLYAEMHPYINATPYHLLSSWESSKRRLYDYQFILCTHGKSYVIIHKKKYTLKKGALVIIPPNVPHSFGPDSSETNGLLWFHCDLFNYPDKEWHYTFYNNPESYLSLFNQELKYKKHIRKIPVFQDGYSFPEYLIMDEFEEVKNIFRKIYKEYIEKNDKWHLFVKPLVLDLITRIIKQTTKSNKENYKKNHIVYIIKKFISNNYYRKLSLKEICKETGLNHEYASKIFKMQTGVKIVTYLNKYRVDKSKALLLDADLSITDVAYMVGFNNQNYYSSIVRKFENKTPTELRDCLLDSQNII